MWSLSAKERERQTECKAPLQKEAQVGLGTGRQAEHGLGPGAGVLKGKAVTELLDSQSWWPGSHFYVPGRPLAHKQIA